MIADAARKTVVRNPCASTAATVGTLTALLLWLAPQLGLTMPLWVGSLLTGLLVSAALSFNGLASIWRFLLYGRRVN